MKTLTVGSHTVELKEFITGREQRAIFSTMPKGMTVSASGDVENIDATQFASMQDASIKAVVVSFDGHKDGDEVDGKGFSILDAILDLPADETTVIAEAVSEVINPQKKS